MKLFNPEYKENDQRSRKGKLWELRKKYKLQLPKNVINKSWTGRILWILKKFKGASRVMGDAKIYCKKAGYAGQVVAKEGIRKLA